MDEIVVPCHLMQDGNQRDVLFQLKDFHVSVETLQKALDRVESTLEDEKTTLERALQLEEKLKEEHAKLFYMQGYLSSHQMNQSHLINDDDQKQKQQQQQQKNQSDKENIAKKKTKKKRRSKGRDLPVIPQLEDVSVDEYAQVPKYMKGRITLEKVNAALQEIQRIVAHKYKLLGLIRHKIK